MTVDRGGMLSPVYLDLEIIQEYSGRERIILGTLELNLAEYVGRERENRRYLMQASKINSTVQISTELKQISGDTSFKVPELRPAQVFSGIAGVVVSEPTISEPVEPNSTQAAENPYGAEINLSAHSRERDRAHDIYRKSLAASWQLQTGELNAVDCIEDIFAGGTGWAQDPSRQTATDDNVNSNSNPDDGETRSSHQDLHPSTHRNSSHRLASGWHHNDSWKRTRSFQGFERQDSTASSRPSPRIPLKADSFRSTGSLRPHVASRAVSPGDSGSSRIISISQDRASNVSQHQGWHSLEVAEEDLRDNLISWSL